MATQGERRALMFFALVALLGVGTRLWRARHVEVASGDLDQQIASVESVKAGRRPTRSTGRRSPPPRAARPTPAPLREKVDIDGATEQEIEKLPGIGPALARRIVADRESNGPFGCAAGLDQVKGIGPALLARLDSLITFGGSPRAVCRR